MLELHDGTLRCIKTLNGRDNRAVWGLTARDKLTQSQVLKIKVVKTLTSVDIRVWVDY